MFRFFQAGGLWYGLSYSISRGVAWVRRRWSTTVHRCAVAICGADTIFQEGVYISSPQHVTIGSRCLISANTTLGSEFPDSTLELSDGVQINQNCQIDFTGDLTIEKGVLLSNNVQVFTHDHGYDPRSAPVKCPLVIEANVWVGSGAMILQSVSRIGANSIVAAGSVVTKDIPENVIVAGNPARVIKEKPS